MVRKIQVANVLDHVVYGMTAKARLYVILLFMTGTLAENLMRLIKGYLKFVYPAI